MRRRRKHLALIAACSLAITTVPPGVAYAETSDTDGTAPRITDVRILKERNYLEIRWDQEVQNSIETDNYILKNGENEFQLLTGNWNTCSLHSPLQSYKIFSRFPILSLSFTFY